LALWPASFWILISPISSKVISLEPETMSNNTFWHLWFYYHLVKESLKQKLSLLALFSPSATAEPIIAVPLLDKTVLASLNRYFEYSDAYYFGNTLEAVAKTSSAFENPALKPKFPYTSLNLLLITIKDLPVCVIFRYLF
jgi:hypothetical protein